MKRLYLYIFLASLAACTGAPLINETLDEQPVIFPDYMDITIPYNIAPLNFKYLGNNFTSACLLINTDGGGTVIKRNRKGSFRFTKSEWKQIARANTTAEGTLCIRRDGKWLSYKPFKWQVAPEPVDPYIAYRLIPPGYTAWSEMGIYQRNIETFRQTEIIENTATDANCMNCHSFCNRDASLFMLHFRKYHAGTYIIDNETIQKLDTKTGHTVSPLVYPSWHPSGKFIAFSVNDIRQAFHTNNHNIIEVYDAASDVAVYDVEKRELITSPLLFSKSRFETFPTFSPDGKTLYFCTADTVRMPEDYDKVRYSLCSISFNPTNRTFGATVDTLFNSRETLLSAAMPRVSPDGRFLVFTASSYGNFFIWHRDADLFIYDLQANTYRPLTEANSPFAESYHSWSDNSRWLVFSSRRKDGLYTHPHFAYIAPDGSARKAFVLPQQSPDFYDVFDRSFNIPEFVTSEITVGKHALSKAARQTTGVKINFSDGNSYPDNVSSENIAH